MTYFSRTGIRGPPKDRNDGSKHAFIIGDLAAKAQTHPDLVFASDYRINDEGEDVDGSLEQTVILNEQIGRETKVLGEILYIRIPMEEDAQGNPLKAPVDVKTDIDNCSEALIYYSKESCIKLLNIRVRNGARKTQMRDGEEPTVFYSITSGLYAFVEAVKTAIEEEQT
jgi:hypothetical protein